HKENETSSGYDCVGDEYTATFYYIDDDGDDHNVSSTTASCNLTSAATCSVTIPSAVRSSRGAYDNAYYGLSNTTGNMTAAVASGTTTITLSGDKDYYALYSSQVTIHYPTSTSAQSSTNAAYRNQWLSNKTTMSTTVLATTATGTSNNYSFTSSVSGYSLYGFAYTYGTNDILYGDLAESNSQTVYAVLYKVIPVTFYYSSNNVGAKTNSQVSGNQYIRCTSSGAEINNGTISPPSTTVPFGTTLIGWATSNNSMSTVSVDITRSTYYAVYRSVVTNYYYNGGWKTQTLYRNAIYGSTANYYSFYLSTSGTGTSNYTKANGINSSTWLGLSTAADGIPEYSIISVAAKSSDNVFYTVYRYILSFSLGSNVSGIEKTSDTCNIYATGSSSGTTSCYITLPSITPNEGYYAVGWNTTNNATTGTPVGSQYLVTSSNKRLYANAIDIWAENLNYNNTNSPTIDCTDSQCAIDSLKMMVDAEIYGNEDTNVLYDKIELYGRNSNVNYVRKYNVSTNGEATDMLNSSGNKDVYYYTSPDSNNEAGQNGNVIFDNYCWKIVRTTTDGGVKLVYNGPKTNDDKCPNDSSLRPSSIGVSGMSGMTDLSGNKIYGTSFEIFKDGNYNKFRLLNTNTYNWSDSTYQNIIGKYTCGSGTIDTCTSLFYVSRYESSTQATIARYSISTNVHFSQIGTSNYNPYSDSLAAVGYMYNDIYKYKLGSNMLSYNYPILTNTTMTLTTEYYYGNSVVWNVDHYELRMNGLTPTTPSAWSNIRNSVGGMYTCLSDTNTSCDTVYYIVANSSNLVMYSFPLSNNESANTKSMTWVTGTGYEESGGVYTLTGIQTTTFLLKDWYSNYSNSAYRYKYVCDDFTSSSCSTLYYIYGSLNDGLVYNSSNNNYIYGNSVSYSGGNYTINQDSDPTMYSKIWNIALKTNLIYNMH
ncbi:MAG: hypothetical protein IKI04_02805, partial [Bacilli bacterium]|nr:hypothetical protein [Bacilli bacterium]